MGNSQEPQDFNISVMPSSLTPVHVAKAAEGLNLYDTASHQVSHFVPLKPGEVGIYVCGATVQSSPHIGHIRAAVAFDIVRRWFLKLGYKVTFVRNVTDIDDKILVKAAAAGQRWWARAYYYEREFTEAYNTLGVLPPTVEPRATGHSGIPGYRARIRPIVSRITIHWPSFYNVVTGKTLALPNLIALQHIPLSPAGVIAKRPAPIALPNSCAAEWRMAPDAVFSPYASVRYFTPHMVHSQYNLL